MEAGPCRVAGVQPGWHRRRRALGRWIGVRAGDGHNDGAIPDRGIITGLLERGAWPQAALSYGALQLRHGSLRQLCSIRQSVGDGYQYRIIWTQSPDCLEAT